MCREATGLQPAAVASAARDPMFLLLLLFMVEKVGLKPTTFRLKSERSFTELLPHVLGGSCRARTYDMPVQSTSQGAPVVDLASCSSN